VLYIMIPVASSIYAVLFSFLHWFEGLLPQVRSLLLVEKTSQFFNVVDLVEDLPPVTLPRMRAATGPWDWLVYSHGRCMRIPAYYYEQASSRLGTVVQWGIFCTLAVRVTCIFFGARALFPLFLAAASVFAANWELREKLFVKARRPLAVLAFFAVPLLATLPNAYKKHREWFGNLRNSQELSDKVLWHVSKGVFYIGREEFAKFLSSTFLVATLVLVGAPLVWWRLRVAWAPPKMAWPNAPSAFD